MRPTVSIVLLVLAGCTAGDAAEPTLVRDSAGIAIVENSADAVANAAVWSLGEAEVAIGVVEGEPAYQLYGVGGGTRLADGTIVLLNAGTSELRFFDANGVHLRSAGGDGEGPGEFRGATAVAPVSGDSLLVWDQRLQRISLFDAAGEFGRSFRVERAVLNPEFLGVFDDGSVAILDLRLDVPAQGFAISSSTLVKYGRDGSFTDSLGTYPWMEIGIIGGRERGVVGGRIFAPRTSAAAAGDRFWVGTAAEPSIEQYDRDGVLTRIVRWEAGDRTVGPDDRRRFIDERFTDPTSPMRAAYEELGMHDRFPAHAELGADRDGNLWVKPYRRPAQEGPDRWLVFDPEGALLARIELPEELRVLEVRGDRLLAVRPDELEVERVVVYELRKPADEEGP